MGFFKDFKRDFAQAVNELMPDKDELAGEYDDEDMVNTFDENDNMDIAPEDLLEDIDDYGDNGLDIENPPEGYAGYDVKNEEENIEKVEEPVDETFNVPEAELISEHDFNNLDEMNVSEEDELRTPDALDEAAMLEGLENAQLTEGEEETTEGYYGNPFEQINESRSELHEMDLEKDIEAAISKEDLVTDEGFGAASDTDREALADTDKIGEGAYTEDVAVRFPEADRFREDVMAEVELNSQANEKVKNLEDVFEVDTTYITKKTKLNGDICTEGSIDVLGTVNGNVECNGKLIIGGTIKGNIVAGEIYANAAKVEGEVKAEGSVKIGVGSIVVGDISSTAAMIAGAVNGDIDVHGPVIVDSTAVIMGNIKSRSVQINNGAVIEGFCSQCYSEIDVKSFFDMDEDVEDEAAENTDEAAEEETAENKNESAEEETAENKNESAEEETAENKHEATGEETAEEADEESADKKVSKAKEDKDE